MPIINGMAPYLLQHLKVLAGVNDPSVKITPAGFLKLAVDNSPQLGIAAHSCSGSQNH